MKRQSPHPFTTELTVESYLHGVRIDSFLVRHFRNYSSFRMQRMVAAGCVSVEHAPAEVSTRVFSGQRVQVRLVEPPDKLLDANPLPLDVLFEDAWLIVVNKPAGQVVHPVGEFQSGTLANALQYHLDRQTPLPGLLRPGIVHRLDRMTSGVVVVTKHHLAHRILSIQFQRARVQKSYLAIVDGLLRRDHVRIDAPLGLLAGGESILMTCSPDAINAKPAITEFEVIRRLDDATIVRAVPITGRIHQIRVHLAHIGHPVLGDEFYGPFGEIRRSRFDAAGHEATRHALHAAELTFRHPISRELLTFAAPLPDDIRELCEDRATARQVSEPSVVHYQGAAS